MLLEQVRKTLGDVLGEQFQWAPTLGGECYRQLNAATRPDFFSFNGHPPLWVNATVQTGKLPRLMDDRFNGHPPLWVNATLRKRRAFASHLRVSMGTHPCG